MIYITDSLRIRQLDDRCLEIESLEPVVSKKTKTESLKWVGCGYFGDIKSALLSSLRKQLFESAEDELKVSDLISRINTAESNVITAIQKMQTKEQNDSPAGDTDDTK